MQLGWGRCKLCSLARIARLRSSMASSKRVPESRRLLAACGQRPLGASRTLFLARNHRYRVPSPAGWRYRPTLIWSQSRAAIKPPPPKGSPATFNFARFQTSKTSYLKLILSLTPLVLPSRAVATLELLFVVIISWSSSFRFLFLDCFDTHLPSTLFYLPSDNAVDLINISNF